MRDGGQSEDLRLKRVLPGWRPLTVVFLGLTLLSTVSLYFLAARTERHFAWTINPPLSAAFLGAGYAAGFVLIALTMRERVWANARIAFATVCVFVWVTLLATVLHLDRFHFDVDGTWPRFLAWLWVVVYIVVPPWMTVLLIAQRRAPGEDPEVTTPMPRGLALAMGVQAVVLVAVGIGLVVAPTGLREAWPWALTPLTSRVIGAWFVALGFAAGLAMRERDLSRLRSAAITYVVFGLLEVGALVRFRDDVEWDRAAAWLYVALLVAITATGAFGSWGSVRQRERPELDPV